MPRVICDLPNAPDEISGVKFHRLEDGGMVSDEISQEDADLFLQVTGYSAFEEEGGPALPEKPVAAPAPTARKAGKGKEEQKEPKEPKSGTKKGANKPASKAETSSAEIEQGDGDTAGIQEPEQSQAADQNQEPGSESSVDGSGTQSAVDEIPSPDEVVF